MNRLMHRKRKENMETPTLRMSDRILSVVAITGLLVTILAGVQILGGVTIINLSNGNEPQTAVISDGVQIVDAPITKKGFTSIIVQRDIPCEIHFRVMTGLDECNNEVVIPKFDQDIKLSEGDNVVTILPDEVGVFPYTCGMNMIQATITVAQRGKRIRKQRPAETHRNRKADLLPEKHIRKLRPVGTHQNRKADLLPAKRIRKLRPVGTQRNRKADLLRGKRIRKQRPVGTHHNGKADLLRGKRIRKQRPVGTHHNGKADLLHGKKITQMSENG